MAARLTKRKEDMDTIQNIVADLDRFSNEDVVRASDVMDAVNKSIIAYSGFWKDFAGEANEVDVEEHANVLRNISNIIDSIHGAGVSDFQELVSENYAEDYIKEMLENNYPEIMEYAEYSYDWPSQYIEFDIDAAIQDKISESEEINLSGTTFYIIEI